MPASQRDGEEEDTESMYSLPSDERLAKKFLEESRPNMRKFVKGLSNTDMTKFLTLAYEGGDYEVEDVELCEVCNKPMLFFHDLSRPATRCSAEPIRIAFVESYIFPAMKEEHFINAKFKSILSDVKIRDETNKAQAIAKAASSAIPPQGNQQQIQRVESRKILDAPKWSDKQDLDSFLDALRNWAILHDFANGLQILYALCVSLESTERHDVANELRQFFPPTDTRQETAETFIDKVITHIRKKFARSKRDEMETSWLKLLSAGQDGDIMKIISEFELQIKRLKNLGAEVDEKLLSIQLMLNCKLSKSEKQHAISAIGEIDQSDVYERTKRIIKLLKSDSSSRSTNDPLMSYYGLNYAQRKRSASWSDRQRTPQRDRYDQGNKSPYRSRDNVRQSDRNQRPRTPSRERRERRPSFSNSNNNSFRTRGDTYVSETQEGQTDPLEDTQNCFYTASVDLMFLADRYGCELFGILDTGCPRSVMSTRKAREIVQAANPGFYKISNAAAKFRFGSTRVLEARKAIQLNLKFMDIERRVQFL